MAMQQLIIGILLGCILFYLIIYLLRVVLGPGDFSDKLKAKWAWNIFQPDAVNLEICKEAGVMTSNNCDSYVTCPSSDLATDCPSAGYVKPGSIDGATAFSLDVNSNDHHDELDFISVYNSTIGSSLSTLNAADISNVYFKGYMDKVTSNVIPANANIDTCSNVKSYLEGLMGTTLTNVEAANLTSVCMMSSAQSTELVAVGQEDVVDTDDARFNTGLTPDGNGTVGTTLMDGKFTHFTSPFSPLI